MNRWLGGFWLVGVGAALAVGACAPTSSEIGGIDEPEGGQGGDGGSTNQPGGGSTSQPGAGTTSQPGAGTTNQPDPAVCTPGATRDDGCNTCTCTDDRQWACTDRACACNEGDTRPAGDGCNDCFCIQGEWACTMKLCEDCTAGEVMDDGCTRCVCMLARGGGLTWGCSLNVCECTPGEQRLADDGCNTCTCAENGTWQCTEIGCMACVEGEMRDAGDGCNTCTCDASGSFICTRLYCPVTCEPDSADCDGVRENGCEADLQNSVENCGQCGYYCAHAGASSVCKAGGCFLDRCMDGYEDCNGDPNDGCEAPVGEGGCEDRCEVPNDAPAPSPSDESCNCPEGTACVLGSVENEGRPYCFPLPETCPGYGTCACLGFCVCPADPGAYCYESMAPGGKMDVHCSRSD